MDATPKKPRKAPKAANAPAAARVREARRRCGLSQKAFAAEIDVTPQYLSQIEHGVTPCSAKTQVAIDRTLDKYAIVDNIRSANEAHLLHIYRRLGEPTKGIYIDIGDALLGAAVSDAPRQTTNNKEE